MGLKLGLRLMESILDIMRYLIGAILCPRWLLVSGWQSNGRTGLSSLYEPRCPDSRFPDWLHRCQAAGRTLGGKQSKASPGGSRDTRGCSSVRSPTEAHSTTCYLREPEPVSSSPLASTASSVTWGNNNTFLRVVVRMKQDMEHGVGTGRVSARSRAEASPVQPTTSEVCVLPRDSGLSPWRPAL